MIFNRKYLSLLVFAIPTLLFSQERMGWWNADRSSVGLAPKPHDEKRAIVQIYAARAYSWRRNFGVHTWISIKEDS